MKLGNRVIAYVAVVMTLLSVVVLSAAGYLMFHSADEIARVETAYHSDLATPATDTSLLSQLSGLTGRATQVPGIEDTGANAIWDRTLRTIATLSIGIILAVGFAVALLNRGINTMVLNRVSSLEGVVRRIRRTGTLEPIDFAGNDEIASLAVNIEAMVSELDESRRNVEDARDELELRVRERTAELQAAVEDLQAQIERRALAEQAHALSEGRYRTLIENLSDLVFTIDRAGMVLFVSSAIEPMFGMTPAEVAGRHISLLLGTEAERLLVRLGRALPKEGVVVNVDGFPGTSRSLDLEITLLPCPHDPSTFQGIARDVTARRRQENELLHIASHDFLTGLANRRRFEDRLRSTLAGSECENPTGAVLWLDLDGFKEINDVLGHKAGDDLLVQVARMLSSCVRTGSLIARIGGDEFAILLADADERAAASTAERLLRGFSALRAEALGRSLRVSASIGIVLYPDHGTDAEELLSLADSTMYRAKNLGRSRYRVFEPTDGYRSGAEDARAWTAVVEKSLAAGAFDIFAQPICDANSGLVTAYELLVRLRQQEGSELVLPERFLPIAERSGAIVDVDLWMLSHAVELLESHPDQKFNLNVNLSLKTVNDPRLVLAMESMSKTMSADLSRLTLEISEDAIIADPGGVSDVLRALHALDCRIALDDFGSGFTSFFHLKRLPIDAIKIDGSFVGNMTHSANDRHLVRAMVEMARGLNMATTAEFVESEGTLRMLRVFGIDCVQGHLLGAAAPVDLVLGSHNDRHVNPAVTQERC